jgi:hypothetical protein
MHDSNDGLIWCWHTASALTTNPRGAQAMADMTLAAAKAEIKANPEKVYVYVLSRPHGTPFYVGMGQGRRIDYHERYAALGKRGMKYAVIRKIKREGGNVSYEINFVLNRAAAAVEEMRLIKFYGRHDLGTGCLVNMTYGGDGGPGYKHTKVSLKKMSLASKGKPKNLDHKIKIGLAHKGRTHAPEHVAKSAAAKTGIKHSDTAKERMSVSSKAAWRNPERVLELSARLKAQWADHAYRQMMINNNTGSKRSDQTRAKMTLANLRRYAKV